MDTQQAKKIIDTLYSIWLSQYFIAKVLCIPHNYLTRWTRDQKPGPFFYLCIVKLFEIVKHNINLQSNEKEFKERILKEYKEFTTTPLYALWKEQYPVRGSPRKCNTLSSSWT